MTLDDWLREARRLRDKADASERDFLDFLRGFEQRRDLWQSSAPTFDALLDRVLCGSARYRNWVASQSDPVIAARTGEIGVHGAVAAVRIADVAKRAEAIEEMVRSVAHNGTVLSAQNARTIVGRYAPERSRLPAADAEKQKLLDEINRLRARVAELTATNADLRKQLREVGRASKAGTRSRAAKAAEAQGATA